MVEVNILHQEARLKGRVSVYSLPVIPVQGRMLHVLPSTIKKEASEDASALGSSSYKKKKEAQDKVQITSIRNERGVIADYVDTK